MAILFFEVPLNKDTQRERGREREATAAVELLVHSTHMKSICAEVAPVAFWVVSASPKFNIQFVAPVPTTSSCQLRIDYLIGDEWGPLWRAEEYK